MPRLTLLFARRYLFSKKSHSIINIISSVSAFSIAIPIMAMVVLLSVFNGLEGLIKSMYNNFDPDILVTPIQGKFFDIEAIPHNKLKALDEVVQLSYAVEENAIFEYRSSQALGIMKGVDSLYREVVPIDTLIVNGKYRLRFGDFNEAVIGQGIAYTMGIRTSFNYPLNIDTPRRGSVSSLLPQSIYRQDQIFPSGVFALEAEVDSKYVIVPMDFAQKLLDLEGKASSIAIKLHDNASAEQAQSKITALLGDDFKVKSRYQQKEAFFRIMAYEKWGIYFIILLVLVVASFSLVGSLVMLIIDKQKDIHTLITMGANVSFLRNIFTAEGVLIYTIGATGGMIMGLIICFVQQQFGIIGISAETFLIDAYPVDVDPVDLIWIIVTFTALSFIISSLSARSMITKEKIRIS